MENKSKEGGVEHNFTISIPPYIAKNKELTGNEKLVAGAIFGLCTNLGKCTAKDEYLSSLVGLSSKAVQHIVSSLYKKRVLKNIGIPRYRELILTKHFENITETLDPEYRGANGFDPEYRVTYLLYIINIYIWSNLKILTLVLTLIKKVTLR